MTANSSSPACSGVDLTDRLVQRLREVAQDDVSGRVPVPVVHELEVVDVGQDEADGAARRSARVSSVASDASAWRQFASPVRPSTSACRSTIWCAGRSRVPQRLPGERAAIIRSSTSNSSPTRSSRPNFAVRP